MIRIMFPYDIYHLFLRNRCTCVPMRFSAIGSSSIVWGSINGEITEIEFKKERKTKSIPRNDPSAKLLIPSVEVNDSIDLQETHSLYFRSWHNSTNTPWVPFGCTKQISLLSAPILGSSFNNTNPSFRNRSISA